MNEEYPPCPRCGGQNFKIWKLPSIVILHWVLNPGLAFNELVLGQRIPKVQLICQDCQESLANRSYAPCPHCKTIIPGRSWGIKSGFGNWLGYVCPSCGKRIPCLWNFTSLLILAITSPIWYLPYRYYFRDRIPTKPIPYTGEMKAIPKRVGIYMGVGWGFLMWLIMSLAPALKSLALGHNPDWNPVLLGIPIWAVASALFGFLMYFLVLRKKSRASG